MNSLMKILLVLFFGLIAVDAGAEEKRKPNVVFILTDNHGAWTLGCYGNKEILTPNIERHVVKQASR